MVGKLLCLRTNSGMMSSTMDIETLSLFAMESDQKSLVVKIPQIVQGVNILHFHTPCVQAQFHSK
ncbi:hypothetical protein ACSBR2_015464 [Camellia fascicularis]